MRNSIKIKFFSIFWLLTYLCTCSFILCIRLYQLLLSPLLGQNCRFFPTCSSYMIESLQKHGLWKGFWLGFRRICKCHPRASSCNDDPVP